jgi:hypothetical protein
MAPLPVDVLLGVYLGLLTGIIPGLVSWGLGFGFKYFTGVSIPGFGVVVLAVALAGVSGGLLALTDPQVTQSAQATTVVTAILVVTAISLYAHAKGDQLALNVPRRLTLSGLRDRRLSADVVELLGGRDEVTIRATAPVTDMEGYPPLSPELRADVQAAEYAFPADLRVAELEARFADRLRTEFDLGDVAVAIDDRGRATVSAAPPFSGLSKRVPSGERAVSVDALLPTGLARGDDVTLLTADAQVRGTVVSARSDGVTDDEPLTPPTAPDPDPTAGDGSVPAAVHAPTTTGGNGRLTAAVTRTDAEPLVNADAARVIVQARGTRLEYELVSLLRRAGQQFRRLSVAPESDLVGASLDDVDPRATYDVAVLAVRRSSGWELAPDGSTPLAADDALFAVGPSDALDAFAEVAA